MSKDVIKNLTLDEMYEEALLFIKIIKFYDIIEPEETVTIIRDLTLLKITGQKKGLYNLSNHLLELVNDLHKVYSM